MAAAVAAALISSYFSFWTSRGMRFRFSRAYLYMLSFRWSDKGIASPAFYWISMKMGGLIKALSPPYDEIIADSL